MILTEIVLQYRGSNNGNLSCTYSYLISRGIHSSKTTIATALRELKHFGMIVHTQNGGLKCGGKNRPSLYAITWNDINTIEYTDGFSMPTEWKVGDLPRLWMKDSLPFKTKENISNSKKNEKKQVHLEYPTGTGCVPKVINFDRKAANPVHM